MSLVCGSKSAFCSSICFWPPGGAAANVAAVRGSPGPVCAEGGAGSPLPAIWPPMGPPLPIICIIC
eukprot:8016743-Heterocapsa_arctica.AAC.1